MNKRMVLISLILMIAVVAACRPAPVLPTLVPTIEPQIPNTEEIAPADVGAGQDNNETDVGENTVVDQPAESSAVSPGGSLVSNADSDVADLQEGDSGATVSEPAEKMVEGTPDLGIDYAGVVLYWLEASTGDGQDGPVIDDSVNYSLEFKEDGTFNYQADCNFGGGSYVQDGERLSLDLGPVTLAVCSGESPADLYIQYLRDVQRFEASANQLTLHLDDSPIQMIFGQGSSAGPESAEVAITGIEWFWTSFSDPAKGPITIDEPAKYSFVLKQDGVVEIKADCNEASGLYELDGSVLSITLEMTTSDDCGPASQWEQFINYLNAAALYFMQDDDLFIDLIYDSGTMRFESAGS